jgi:hypothetical protein
VPSQIKIGGANMHFFVLAKEYVDVSLYQNLDLYPNPRLQNPYRYSVSTETSNGFSL